MSHSIESERISAIIQERLKQMDQLPSLDQSEDRTLLMDENTLQARRHFSGVGQARQFVVNHDGYISPNKTNSLKSDKSDRKRVGKAATLNNDHSLISNTMHGSDSKNSLSSVEGDILDSEGIEIKHRDRGRNKKIAENKSIQNHHGYNTRSNSGLSTYNNDNASNRKLHPSRSREQITQAMDRILSQISDIETWDMRRNYTPRVQFGTSSTCGISGVDGCKPQNTEENKLSNNNCYNISLSGASRNFGLADSKIQKYKQGDSRRKFNPSGYPVADDNRGNVANNKGMTGQQYMNKSDFCGELNNRDLCELGSVHQKNQADMEEAELRQGNSIPEERIYISCSSESSSSQLESLERCGIHKKTHDYSPYKYNTGERTASPLDVRPPINGYKIDTVLELDDKYARTPKNDNSLRKTPNGDNNIGFGDLPDATEVNLGLPFYSNQVNDQLNRSINNTKSETRADVPKFLTRATLERIARRRGLDAAREFRHRLESIYSRSSNFMIPLGDNESYKTESPSDQSVIGIKRKETEICSMEPICMDRIWRNIENPENKNIIEEQILQVIKSQQVIDPQIFGNLILCTWFWSHTNQTEDSQIASQMRQDLCKKAITSMEEWPGCITDICGIVICYIWCNPQMDINIPCGVEERYMLNSIWYNCLITRQFDFGCLNSRWVKEHAAITKSCLLNKKSIQVSEADLISIVLMAPYLDPSDLNDRISFIEQTILSKSMDSPQGARCCALHIYILFLLNFNPLPGKLRTLNALCNILAKYANIFHPNDLCTISIMLPWVYGRMARINSETQKNKLGITDGISNSNELEQKTDTSKQIMAPEQITLQASRLPKAPLPRVLPSTKISFKLNSKYHILKAMYDLTLNQIPRDIKHFAVFTSSKSLQHMPNLFKPISPSQLSDYGTLSISKPYKAEIQLIEIIENILTNSITRGDTTADISLSWLIVAHIYMRNIPNNIVPASPCIDSKNIKCKPVDINSKRGLRILDYLLSLALYLPEIFLFAIFFGFLAS